MGISPGGYLAEIDTPEESEAVRGKKPLAFKMYLWKGRNIWKGKMTKPQ